MKRILIVGDVFLDEYVYGYVRRLASDFPGPIFEPRESFYYLGGAGNVAANVKAMLPHCEVHLQGAISTAYESLLKGVVLHQTAQFTALKQRLVVVGHDDDRVQQKLMRVDHNAYDHPEVTELVEGDWDLVIYSDYAKGTITRHTPIPDIHDCVSYMDSKRPDAMWWADKVCILKMNEHEFKVSGPAPREAAASILVTHGRKPVQEWYRGELKYEVPVYALEREETAPGDFSGAGDTFLAGLAYSHIDHGTLYDPRDPVRVANVAAAIAVNKKDTSTVSSQEIKQQVSIAKIKGYFNGRQKRI